jgi:16S rRNA (guanine966-N2)-methyltransferase
MRILGGKFKGKNLFSSQDLSIRPLTNHIKKSIFDVLQNRIEGKSVLDLFSGSGSFGLEALSRGAVDLTLVEKSDKSLAVLQKNIDALPQSNEKVRSIKSDVINYCQQTDQIYDFILMDPPFIFPEIQNLVDLIFKQKILKKNGIMVVHHEITNPIMASTNAYVIRQQKKFGRSLVSFLINRE